MKRTGTDWLQHCAMFSSSDLSWHCCKPVPKLWPRCVGSTKSDMQKVGSTFSNVTFSFGAVYLSNRDLRRALFSESASMFSKWVHSAQASSSSSCKILLLKGWGRVKLLEHLVEEAQKRDVLAEPICFAWCGEQLGGTWKHVESSSLACFKVEKMIRSRAPANAVMSEKITCIV